MPVIELTGAGTKGQRHLHGLRGPESSVKIETATCNKYGRDAAHRQRRPHTESQCNTITQLTVWQLKIRLLDQSISSSYQPRAVSPSLFLTNASVIFATRA